MYCKIILNKYVRLSTTGVELISVVLIIGATMEERCVYVDPRREDQNIYRTTLFKIYTLLLAKSVLKLFCLLDFRKKIKDTIGPTVCNIIVVSTTYNRSVAPTVYDRNIGPTVCNRNIGPTICNRNIGPTICN
jgi:hypothetical protein